MFGGLPSGNGGKSSCSGVAPGVVAGVVNGVARGVAAGVSGTPL